MKVKELKEEIQRVRKLIGDKILEINAEYKCPFCREEVFSISIGEARDMIYVFGSEPEVPPMTTLPTIYMICSNCGHITPFAVKTLIKNWNEITSKKVEKS